MKLGDLLTVMGLNMIIPPVRLEQDVKEIVYDSRKVTPGSLFVAIRGFRLDGHEFIGQAVNKGAIAIIAERDGIVEEGIPVEVIRVPDSRVALARIAAAYYRNPSQKLKLIGITGTKGKTTTSYLVKSIIEAAGHKSGLIGTIDHRVVDKVYPALNTTPESLDIQKLLREMVDAGCGYCVMEVSSHSLALGRTTDCVFETAVFTNLKQDHLDFHHDMKSYFHAKLRLFTGLASDKAVVVNTDEPRSQDIILQTNAMVMTFGMSEQSDIHPMAAIGQNINGLSFSVCTPQGVLSVNSSLVGKYNVYNILAAIGVGVSLGFNLKNIAQGIEIMKAVPGRMEKVDQGQQFGVVVDYAHTEDSLRQLLDAVREMARGMVITLFGCGGDRDKSKRPKMGAVAIESSDVCIVTSDNPRSEDPLAIINEIETGMTALGRKIEAGEAFPVAVSGRKPYYIIPDRREAISVAIRMAQPGDVVVLAGKGHEDYQIIGERRVHFDDREIAREEILKRQAK